MAGKIEFFNTTHTRTGDVRNREIEKVLNNESLGIWLKFDTYSPLQEIENVYKLKGVISQASYGFALRKDWKFAEAIKGTFDNYTRY